MIIFYTNLVKVCKAWLNIKLICGVKRNGGSIVMSNHQLVKPFSYEYYCISLISFIEWALATGHAGTKTTRRVQMKSQRAEQSSWRSNDFGSLLAISDLEAIPSGHMITLYYKLKKCVKWKLVLKRIALFEPPTNFSHNMCHSSGNTN